MLTNRFYGSREAERAERNIERMTTAYQRDRVRCRLVLAAMCFLLSALEPFVHAANGDKTGNLAGYIIVRTGLPVLFLLTAAALCSWRCTRAYWRIYVCAAVLLAYNAVLWADVLKDTTGWSPADANYSSMLQAGWFLIAAMFTALTFSLDFWWYVCVTVVVEGLCAVMGISIIWSSWRRSHLQTCDDFLDGRLTALELARTADSLLWCNITTNGHYVGWSLSEALFVTTFGGLLLLLSFNRINRFERHCHVNAELLMSKSVIDDNKKLGKNQPLLALFSSPNRVPTGRARLQPLQLGQELKFVLRAVPVIDLAVEPAASFDDVHRALDRCKPRLLHFSGHSEDNELIFEASSAESSSSYDGLRQPVPPAEFIAALERAPNLVCCVLNACNTAELGYEIVRRLPAVMVVCWSSDTLDAAARSFTLGFYNAIGAVLKSGLEICEGHIELAFWSGLMEFICHDWRWGDPNSYLHESVGIPRCWPPLRECEHCWPPVQGEVQLLRYNQVHACVERLTFGNEESSEHTVGADLHLSGDYEDERTVWKPAELKMLRPRNYLHSRTMPISSVPCPVCSDRSIDDSSVSGLSE
mmetsp:Transcript_43462/g.86952  ORF Transcript_43462/g.86952 Transcript_43462/m.86952 type:complete len:586 (-) Transcript_43462:197-1954(-)